MPAGPPPTATPARSRLSKAGRPGPATPPAPARTAAARAVLLSAAFALAFATGLRATESPPPAPGGRESSFPAPLAARALLLDVARAGNRLVAVGDYGIVVLSDDNGASWRQVIVPARAMLTGVSFASPTHGWAVGHDGVILGTADGGETWTRLDAGDDLETIFLDVLFTDTQRGYAVGAYGKFVATEDGGRTWLPRQPAEEDLHYNRITAGDDGRLFLAGEAGAVLVSDSAGRTWRRLDLPYEGSLFGVLPLGPDRLVAYGLRGHILTSGDGGETWSEQDNPITALVMAGIRLRDGRVVLAGQGGNLFVQPPGGGVFAHRQPDGLGTGIADLVETADGALVAVGEAGAVRLPPP